jgi:DoxX-like family
MFYRVDYAMAVLLAGFLAGVVFGGKFRNIAPSRLARGYYITVAVALVLRTLAFAVVLLGQSASVANSASHLLGDLLSILFGALFGLAVRRQDARSLLTDSSVFEALTMTLAFTFCVASLGKALSLTSMTEFFRQSGYSVGFLKFIVMAETFGGLGLLIPWAVAPALIGLGIDMFGAVITHIHNGDPLNDSTGAIGMLIRLVAIGALWTLRRQKDESPHGVRNSLLIAGAATLACLLVAAGGSVVVRHLG